MTEIPLADTVIEEKTVVSKKGKEMLNEAFRSPTEKFGSAINKVLKNKKHTTIAKTSTLESILANNFMTHNWNADIKPEDMDKW